MCGLPFKQALASARHHRSSGSESPAIAGAGPIAQKPDLARRQPYLDAMPEGAYLRVCCQYSYTLAVRRRNELRTTDIEEALMAKAANMGLIRMPKTGNRIPAAIGTPAVL